MTATIDNQAYFNKGRRSVKAFVDAYQELKDMQFQWSALDYGNTLMDGSGVNEGISTAELGACIFGTADAVTDLLATGHATNLAKLL